MIAFDDSFLLAALAVGVAGLLRGFTGFGAALIIVPALTLLYSPLVGVVAIMLIDIPANVQLLPKAWKIADWRMVRPMVIGAALATPLGIYVLVIADGEAIQNAIGVMVIVSGLLLASGVRIDAQPSTKLSFLVGALSGGIGGAVSMSGPPVVLFFLAAGRAAASVRAGIIVYFALTSVIRIAGYAIAGVILNQTLWLSLFLAPIYVATIWIGSRLFNKSGERIFRLIAVALVVVMGAATLLA